MSSLKKRGVSSTPLGKGPTARAHLSATSPAPPHSSESPAPALTSRQDEMASPRFLQRRPLHVRRSGWAPAGRWRDNGESGWVGAATCVLGASARPPSFFPYPLPPSPSHPRSERSGTIAVRPMHVTSLSPPNLSLREGGYGKARGGGSETRIRRRGQGCFKSAPLHTPDTPHPNAAHVWYIH